jgi:hypothetical protein
MEPAVNPVVGFATIMPRPIIIINTAKSTKAALRLFNLLVS